MTELTQKELIELATLGAQELSIQFYELWKKTGDEYFNEKFSKYVDIADNLKEKKIEIIK